MVVDFQFTSPNHVAADVRVILISTVSAQLIVPGLLIMHSTLKMRATLLLMTLCLTASGCSAWMAATAPHHRDLGVLTPGVSRTKIVAELGEPLTTIDVDSQPRDLFAFKQGYSKGALFGRAAVHIVADVMTLGFWEIVAVPLEASLQGEDVRAQVDYDESDRVSGVRYFAGAHLRNGKPVLASWMRGSKTEQTVVIDSDIGNGRQFERLTVPENTSAQQKSQLHSLVQQQVSTPTEGASLTDEKASADGFRSQENFVTPASASVVQE